MESKKLKLKFRLLYDHLPAKNSSYAYSIYPAFGAPIFNLVNLTQWKMKTGMKDWPKVA